ncbi:MAG: YraN family protein [Bacteroidales bacterium]
MKAFDIGRIGEAAAVLYLLEKKYKVIETNYRVGHREIDIIAELPGKIVFVEVKTRSVHCLLNPQKAVDRRKQMFLVSAAQEYIQKKKIEKEARFDIICLKKRKNEMLVVEHIVEAFYAFGG